MASYYASFFDSEEPHFLESCSLCRKHLGLNSDIFMYRGDKAFCSNECREEQIEYDEAKERSWKLSARSLRKNLLKLQKIQLLEKPYGQEHSWWRRRTFIT